MKNAQDANGDTRASELQAEAKKKERDLFDKIAGENGLADLEIKRCQAKIDEYKSKRSALLNDTQAKFEAEVGKNAADLEIPAPLPDPESATGQGAPDFFTAITLQVSSSTETERSSSSASSVSFGASVSWGWWWGGGSVSSSYSHSEAHAAAYKEMAEASVNISFECMRVDIVRPWLRPELFYDDDLICDPHLK